MQPGHGKPGGHAFLSDVSRGNGGVLRGRNGGGGRGVRATPRGPLRGPETAGSAENAPRGGLHGLPDTGPPALRGTRDPLPGSASVASGPQPAHARGWGVGGGGREPAHARRELPSCWDLQAPPTAPLPAPRRRPAGWAGSTRSPTGGSFPPYSPARSAQWRPSPRGEVRQRSGRTTTPRNPRGAPRPAAPKRWPFCLGNSGQPTKPRRPGREPSPVSPRRSSGARGHLRGRGSVQRQAAKSQQPLRVRRCRPGDKRCPTRRGPRVG